MSEMIERVVAAMVFSTMQVGGDFCVVRRLAGELMVGAHDFEVVERCNTIPEMIAATRKLNARAAIVAMREPTEWMLKVVERWVGAPEVHFIYQAMINEVLK